MPNIFVSYSRKDLERVKPIVQELLQKGPYVVIEMAPTVLFQARTSVRLNEWYIGYSSVFGLRERDTFFRTASLRCPFSSGIGLTETFGANAFSQSVRPRTLETLMIVLSDEPLSPSRFFSAPTLIDARAASSVCSRLALQSWNRRACMVCISEIKFT